MTKHAKFSPSSIARGLKCSGSYTLPKLKQSSAAADEGTLAHECCEKTLLNEPLPSHPEEMDEHIKAYCDFVEKVFSEHDDSVFWVEKQLKVNDLHYGTADVVGIAGNTLWVIDLKYGFAPVEADAPQLKDYGWMALVDTSLDYDRQLIENIKTVVFQPRISHTPKIAEHSVDDLLNFGEEVMNLIRIVSEDQCRFQAGDHCQYCNKLKCPEIERIRKNTGRPPEQMKVEELSERLLELDGLEAYIKEVRNYAYGQAIHGSRIPGFKLVRKNTHRKWSPSVQIEQLDDLFGDKAYTKKYLTPTQALKLSKDIPDDWIIKPEGESILVPASDKRPETIAEATAERLVEVMSL